MAEAPGPSPPGPLACSVAPIGGGPARWRDSDDARRSPSEHLAHVAGVKSLFVRLLQPAHGGLELGQGIGAAFRVRVVSREHEQFAPRLLHHPAHRFAGERRELEVLTYVLRWHGLEAP